VATDATMTKLTATPAEVALRASILTTMVHNQTTTPVGTTAVGRRHARAASHPTAVPIRNGQAVSANTGRGQSFGVTASSDDADQHADDVGERSQRAISSHRSSRRHPVA
jgi:hypothetical protein